MIGRHSARQSLSHDVNHDHASISNFLAISPDGKNRVWAHTTAENTQCTPGIRDTLKSNYLKTYKVLNANPSCIYHWGPVLQAVFYRAGWRNCGGNKLVRLITAGENGTFTFMHLADNFIQSFQAIHFISMCDPWESNPQSRAVGEHPPG